MTMKRAMALGFPLLLALCCTALAHGQELKTGRRAPYVRTRTFQNLAYKPGIFGHYLTVDPDTGRLGLSPVSNQVYSHTFWELRGVYKHRDYRAHVMLSRANSPLNNRSLGVDPVSGQLLFTKGEIDSSYWLIRYAGKYNGWDAYFLQTLAETDAGVDLAFLTADPATGVVDLSATPTPGSFWHMTFAPDLPAESRY
jgi:hypothetical protein